MAHDLLVGRGMEETSANTPAKPRAPRRAILLHTAGPYPGLRQIIGLIPPEDQAPSPEVLPPPGTVLAMELWPDGRPARALRLKATPRFVLYREIAAGAEEAAA